MKALVFARKPVRYAAAAVAGRVAPGAGARVGPLALKDVDPPALPGDGWVRFRPRLAGICGSDLATLDGRSSRYFEPIVSFPFTPGHEVVGDLDDGTRAVLVPVLTCETRDVHPPCAMCAAGRINLCERIAFGHLEPGLQSGFCADTGGGWSTAMIAHRSQLIPVPAGMIDEAAVMIEPTACAVHAAASVPDAATVAVIGAGTLGLLTIAALHARRSGPLATTEGSEPDQPTDSPEPAEPAEPAGEQGPRSIVATAKHPEQRRLARELGADRVVEPGELDRAIRSATGSFVVDGQLTGGVDTVVDCVGSAASLGQALRVVAPAGEVIVVGMPGHVGLDLTPLWHRETRLRGCYAYTRADFDRAVDIVARRDLGRLVSATYPLDRYTDAVEHAANAGARGAVKIAFDLRGEKRR